MKKYEFTGETKQIRIYIKNWILIGITLMAAYLVFASIGFIELPEFDGSWYPVQICMFVVGIAWIRRFCMENGLYSEADKNDQLYICRGIRDEEE